MTKASDRGRAPVETRELRSDSVETRHRKPSPPRSHQTEAGKPPPPPPPKTEKK